MRMRRFWLVVLVIVLSGCASWHARVRPGFDWSTVSTVSLQGPDEAYSELVATAREELEGMGYRVVLPAESSEAQVDVQLAVVEALDIDESGKTYMRPKSLHTRFYKAVDQALVAESSYYLGPSENPRQGVKALFAGVWKKQAQAAAAPAPVTTSQPLAAGSVAKPAVLEPERVEAASTPSGAVGTVSAVPPSQGPTTEVVSTPALPASAPPTSATVVPGDGASSASSAPATPAAKPAPVANQPLADDDWDKPRGELPAAGEPSPWVPRFQSWGFSEWGKSRELE